MNFQHKHCYVFEFLLTTKHGTDTIRYSFLTNISDPMHKQNRVDLEQALRIAYGYYPKAVKYKYDKYQ